jgi:RNA-directed DNA polymerase
VISPLLANVALHGLETAIVSAFPRWSPQDGKELWAPIVVRYADDCAPRRRGKGARTAA